MKAYISVDLEGMPYVVIPGHLNLKGSLYEEARKIATKVTLIVVEELHKNGFDEVTVSDSHGPMVNLLVEDLPEYSEIIRGFPRKGSMVADVGGCDAALFLGYHAKFGTAQSTLDHTYSGRTVSKLCVNGVETSEFLLNTYVAGERGVPVILVAGEAKLVEEVKRHASWVETYALKHSLSRVSAKSSSWKTIEQGLKKAVKNAVTGYTQNKTEILTANKPVKMSVTFQASHLADAAELYPEAKRVDGLTVEYTSRNMVEAFNTFQLLVFAATGISYLLTQLT